MVRDPLWIHFPRWILESDIPRYLTETMGLEAWVVFRNLIEIDCETNLTPDWFVFRIETISQETGILPERIDAILDTLEDQKWIERLNTHLEYQSACISCPLPIAIDEKSVRSRIAGEGIKGGNFLLRYKDRIGLLEKIERVIYLYQMLFGMKFSPRIVDDLEEIANQYPMEIIYELFQEAYQKNVKTLSWIKSRLPDTVSSKPDSEER